MIRGKAFLQIQVEDFQKHQVHRTAMTAMLKDRENEIQIGLEAYHHDNTEHWMSVKGLLFL